MQFTWGTDPEFMLMHHNELRSAIDILPAKENAFKKTGNEYYFDNVLAEIAVKPAKNKDDAIIHIKKSLHELARIISPGKFVIKAAANYPFKEINCLKAKIAACNPEWDAYTLQCVFPPDEVAELIEGYYQFKTPFRSAGGHIHLGAEKLQDHSTDLNVVRMMDLFIGIPSLFLDTDDTSLSRRKLYGHAGSHRTTEYGLEYRVLGNFWLSSPRLVSLIYDLCEFVLNFVEAKNHEKFWSVNEDLLDEEDPSVAYDCFGYDVNSLINCINNCDKSQADKFMMFIANYLPESLYNEIEKLSGQPLPDVYESWGI